MNDTYTDLRRRYPSFEYLAYHYTPCAEGLRLSFEFRMGDILFHPTALIERRPFLALDEVGTDIDRLVFDIGMAELVSYWKCACPPNVSVRCGSLTASQIAFWRKLYWHGLGEFFYTNGISEATADDFLVLSADSSTTADAAQPHRPASTASDANRRCLVPIGGGKDSVVSLELLRRLGRDIRPLIMNPRGATTECARVAGYSLDEVLVVRRAIDPTLLELNARGYLNGHTPFSAMLAFYTRLASALSGIADVALSNESSANESTVLGSTVNHQYSKSLEFEDDFRAYTAGEPFRYYSLLRPLSELQIAMLFASLPQYHDVFRSCNVGSKTDIWCGHCAKCLFAYIILSPFIAPSRLAAIFGRPMLDDAELRPCLMQLLGMAPTKPFECVGTVDEVRQALALTAARWYADGASLPTLLEGLDLCPQPIAPMPQPDAAHCNLTADEYQALASALDHERAIFPSLCREVL